MGCEFCKPSIDPSEQAGEQAIEINTNKKDESPILDARKSVIKDEETLKKNKDFLAKVKLFKRLPKDQHDVLASCCFEETHPPGHVLIKQGDEGDAFYVIVSGSVEVSVDGKKVATLGPGDYLGEGALLRDEPRNASITANKEITILKITRAKFQEMQLADKLEFKHRVAVAGMGGGGEAVIFPPSDKTAEDKNVMMKALKSNKNLTEIVDLDDAKCNALIAKAWEEKVMPGRAIIEQGSDQADYFYIVKKGDFDVFVAKTDEAVSAEDAMREQAQVGSIPVGGSFGELALIFYAPRAATVKARNDAIVWVIDRTTFKNVFAAAAANKAKENVRYLNQASFFDCLKADEKTEVVVALSDVDFKKGEVIYEEGDTPSNFYFLVDGEIAEIKGGKEVKRFKATLAKGELFGEAALIGNDKRKSTMKIVSESAKCLQMDRVSFEILLAPYSEIKKRGNAGETFVGHQSVNTSAIPGAPSAKAAPSREKIDRKDLRVLGLLGCGGFGAVELVEHQKTKETYALKSLSKGHVVKCRMQKSVIQEKTIQHMCDSFFIVKLYECFNEPQNLCFLLELALGGELYDTYCKKGFHGSVRHAHFYSASTLYAFEHLHEKKIVYRDLKPENLLLTDTGYCKLTDMGLAKIVVGKTNTTCGTPDYFAPEVIAGAGHSHAVDWWTLGILIFELIAGHPPFESDHPAQTMKKIQNGIEKVNFPKKLKQGNGQDLIYGLLKKQPNDRLPMRKGWTDNVKTHAWYDKFDWQGMITQTVEAPYKPLVKNKKDLKNFSANAGDKPPKIPYKDDGTGWDKDFAT